MEESAQPIPRTIIWVLLSSVDRVGKFPLSLIFLDLFLLAYDFTVDFFLVSTAIVVASSTVYVWAKLKPSANKKSFGTLWIEIGSTKIIKKNIE